MIFQLEDWVSGIRYRSVDLFHNFLYLFVLVFVVVKEIVAIVLIILLGVVVFLVQKILDCFSLFKKLIGRKNERN